MKSSVIVSDGTSYSRFSSQRHYSSVIPTGSALKDLGPITQYQNISNHTSAHTVHRDRTSNGSR
uniref:Uncharacterized protein n=1 Tax=Anguilla anguilla TaxID=7936 RepID=A0A0E9XPA1_ANGAN